MRPATMAWAAGSHRQTESFSRGNLGRSKKANAAKKNRPSLGWGKMSMSQQSQFDAKSPPSASGYLQQGNLSFCPSETLERKRHVLSPMGEGRAHSHRRWDMGVAPDISPVRRLCPQRVGSGTARRRERPAASGQAPLGSNSKGVAIPELLLCGFLGRSTLRSLLDRCSLLGWRRLRRCAGNQQAFRRHALFLQGRIEPEGPLAAS